MAERPDLEYWVPILRHELAGRTIRSVSVAKPTVLRQAVEGSLLDLLANRVIADVERCGHFVRFRLSQELDLVFSPMLAGRFDIVDAAAKKPVDVAVSFELTDGRKLRYRDSVQMGKVYVIPFGADDTIPGLSTIGINVLDGRRFSRTAFRKLAKGRRDQVRVFLMDKSAFDCLGNAYADEVLFAAGIHPKTWTRDLDAADLDRLHRAIRDVLSEATRTIEKAKPALDVKLRDFLQVRNRHKQPCPKCGTPIRKAGVRGYDSFFCPSCQPATRKTSIVDWRKKPS